MDNERCKEHKCGGERKRSREFDRELESGPGLFDGVLVDEMSRHEPHNRQQTTVIAPRAPGRGHARPRGGADV